MFECVCNLACLCVLFIVFACVVLIKCVMVMLSVRREEEDLEEKKSIKKRVKELKVLDAKIAQNLCEYPSVTQSYTYSSIHRL